MRKSLVILIFVPGLLFAQDFSRQYQLINAGHADSVRQALPMLMSAYPQHPEVLYLGGLVEPEGEKALFIYRELLSKYPQSAVADDALLKIVEYLYTKGLYNKSTKYSRELLKVYPETNLVEKTVYFLLSSLNALNQKDSVDFFYQYYMNLYPEANFYYIDYRTAPQYNMADESYTRTAPEQKPPETPRKESETKKNLISAPSATATAMPGKYTLQMGVFSKFSNASLLKERLEKLGFSVSIEKNRRGANDFYAVKTGSYESREAAQKAGARMKSEHNLDFVIISK